MKSIIEFTKKKYSSDFFMNFTLMILFLLFYD